MTSSAASSRAGRPARAGRGTTPEVQGVTTAAAGRSADREARMKVYLVQMLLRTACFVAALFTHGWWQLGFILGAVVLPYVAVVRVNNTGPQQAGTLRAVPAQGPALTPRPTTRRRPSRSCSPATSWTTRATVRPGRWAEGPRPPAVPACPDVAPRDRGGPG